MSDLRQLIKLVETMRSTPADAFLQAWNEGLSRRDPHLHVYLKAINDHEIELQSIWVEKAFQRQGFGTAALNQLTKLADETGVSIVLYPETTAGAEYYERLEQYYTRFGFVSLGGDSMIYEPSESDT